jgi:hypothetical protein
MMRQYGLSLANAKGHPPEFTLRALLLGCFFG